MIVKPPHRRAREQTAYLEQLIQSDVTIAAVFTLAQEFGTLLPTGWVYDFPTSSEGEFPCIM